MRAAFCSWTGLAGLLACLALGHLLNAAELPGKAGVYCRLTDVRESPAALNRTMREIKDAGIDFILPYAKLTTGKVNWASRVAPAELAGATDLMEKVVKAAHEAGLKVYPVFCVATEGGDEKTNALLERNPSWAFVVGGRRVGYMDPGNAQARRYEIDLMVELVSRYPVDGLSLDYMRAPNRVGYTLTAREEFLKSHRVDLAELTALGSEALDTEGGKKAAAGAAVKARSHPVWPAYRAWRQDQLNGFMRELRAAVREARPGLPIASYCWGAHTYTGNFETCQDWKRWIAEGWLDWINPSGYRYTDEAFREAAELNRRNVPKGFPYYITLGVSTSHGKLPDVAAIKRQLDLSRQAGAEGIIFFTWEALRKFMPEAGDAIRQWQPLSKFTNP